ncbi:MAG TPA: tyrosine-type recombinase/integrase [Herpetosiphonaceae bacterium]
MTAINLLADWTTWLATDAPRRIRPTTVVSYRRQVTFFAAWLTDELGIELTPAAVTPMRLDSYLDDLRVGLHRKPATVNLAVAALQSFGAWMVEAGHLPNSPARRLRAIPEQPQPPKALSRSLMRKIRDAAHHTGDLRDALVIDLLAHSGLRASEVAGIQIEQLERGARTTWIHVVGKGGKHRRVPLAKPVGQVLDAYLDERTEREGIRPTDGPLLIGIRGGITRTTINRIVADVVARSTLTPAERELVTPHAFRHTVATELARSQHLVVAADMLGHASLTTTRRYVKASAEELETAVDHLYH